MRSLLAGIAFLTRFPVGRAIAFERADVARAAGWFPAIGLVLGAIYCGVAWLLRGHLPRAVISVLLVALDAVLTGALHWDGLADTADGFGGGRSREDVLRIMRDHLIGSYGGAALVLVAALKITAYAALLARSDSMAGILLTPGLGRWSILPLAAALPHARESGSVMDGVGKWPLAWGTGAMVAALAAARCGAAWMAMGAAAAVSALFGIYCHRRIAGITGDALGANLQLCESAALLAFIWVR